MVNIICIGLNLDISIWIIKLESWNVWFEINVIVFYLILNVMIPCWND